MIEIIHLFKKLEDQMVLTDVNLKIALGEILVVLGGSGAGKSVLLQHLIGLMKPDRGSIMIDSKDITRLKERELLQMRKNIGFLFQEGALYDFMNVFENIAFPLQEHTTMNESGIRAKVKEALKIVGLEGADEKFPSELSGGMKKRAALARAIILDSKILFCDEPTSGLDPILSKDITDLIQNISRQLKCTTIITSHDMKNALRIADRVAIVFKGAILATGTQKDILSSQNAYVREFLN